MRIYRLLVFAFLLFFIAACYEIHEDIAIQENGSGRYSTRVDMSALIEMMQTFAGEEELSRGGLDRPIDTVVLFKDVLDSAKDISKEQLELLKKGRMHLVINIKENVFRADMDYPFSSYNDLQLLLSGGGSGMSDVFRELFKQGEGGDSIPAGPANDPMDDLNAIYDVVARNGMISKKVNKDKLNALLEKPDIAQMKQLSGSGMELLYTTTITLPRPVKSINNNQIKVSDNKKTLTLKYNLLDVFTDSGKMDYSIEF